MKKLMGAVLALLSLSASAQDAYIYPGWDTIGEPIPKDDFRYVLFLKKKCELPIANAANLGRAEIYFKRGGKPGVGCWGRTLNPTGAEIVIVDPFGSAETATMFNFAAVKFDRSGQAIVTGPALSIEQYQKNIKTFQDSLR
ncbi:hypothetical protein [Pandoraea sputorum]|uniref:hypothetical protein n=1 Tax=Pandoraea sputorum TaxID=93222 RepID=UPI0012425967|nr:hypothetical protein [Pandoraea sputorum]VVE79418.1 hypothetical protein PSP31120_02223 [Pandoraea sputorum]